MESLSTFSIRIRLLRLYRKLRFDEKALLRYSSSHCA